MSFNDGPVTQKEVDEVREVAVCFDELKHFQQFRRCQPIKIVDHYEDRRRKACELFSHFCLYIFEAFSADVRSCCTVSDDLSAIFENQVKPAATANSTPTVMETVRVLMTVEPNSRTAEMIRTHRTG